MKEYWVTHKKRGEKGSVSIRVLGLSIPDAIIQARKKMQLIAEDINEFRVQETKPYEHEST